MYETGKYICLEWDCGDPEFYAVKGHVSDVKFVCAMKNCGISVEELHEKYSTPCQMQARWSFMNTNGLGWPDDDGPANTLYFYDEKSRGTFDVTVCFLAFESGRES